MTKVSVLGQEPKEELKKIEFVKALFEDDDNNELKIKNSYTSPHKWGNIVLLEKNYRQSGLDLMYVSDFEKPNDNYNLLVLGKFNDGVV